VFKYPWRQDVAVRLFNTGEPAGTGSSGGVVGGAAVLGESRDKPHRKVEPLRLCRAL
jgi:hypothetical protein